MASRDVVNHYLFEVSTEVYVFHLSPFAHIRFFKGVKDADFMFCRANRVGGIYSVLKSKAPVTSAEYRDRYMLIGPLSYKSAPGIITRVFYDVLLILV